MHAHTYTYTHHVSATSRGSRCVVYIGIYVVYVFLLPGDKFIELEVSQTVCKRMLLALQDPEVTAEAFAVHRW